MIENNTTNMETIFQVAKNLGNQAKKPYVILNHLFQVVHSNDLYTQLTGFEAEEIYLQHYATISGNYKSTDHTRKIEAELNKGALSVFEVVHIHRDNRSFTSKLTCIPFQLHDNNMVCHVVFIEDITGEKLKSAYKEVEQSIFTAIEKRKSLTYQLQIICSAIDCLFYPRGFTTIVWHKENKIKVVASSALQGMKSNISLYAADPRYGIYEDFLSADVQTYENLEELPLVDAHRQFAQEQALEKCFVYPIQIQQQRIGAIILLFNADTKQNQPYIDFFDKLFALLELAYNFDKQQKQLNNIAYFDHALDIPNRAGILRNIEALGIPLTVGTIQLIEPTEFSRIVELYGRDVGDQLLKQIVERLNGLAEMKNVRIGRMSSASIMLVTIGKQQEIQTASILEKPFLINNEQLFVTCKNGIAHFQEQGPIEEYMRHAEGALTLAKQQNTVDVCYYDSRHDEKMKRDMQILNHLAAAIKERIFEVYIQPKVDVRTREIIAFEALARWEDPELGFVPPDQFIAIAEKAGWVDKVDAIILEKVLVWLQQRIQRGERVTPVAINISPSHFYKKTFIEELIQLMAKYEVNHSLLIIEVTENLGLVNIEQAEKIIYRLNEAGFQVSVDDFGIGHSSLSYLQKLAFSELKIDRSFTSRLHEESTFAIVRSIIQIAQNLKFRLVAEGVETSEQAEALLDLGCSIAQGYLFYKPMPLSEAEKYM